MIIATVFFEQCRFLTQPTISLHKLSMMAIMQIPVNTDTLWHDGQHRPLHTIKYERFTQQNQHGFEIVQ